MIEKFAATCAMTLYRLIFFSLGIVSFLTRAIPRRRSSICFIGHQGLYNGNAKFFCEFLSNNEPKEFLQSANLKIYFFVRQTPHGYDNNDEIDLVQFSGTRGLLRCAKLMWGARLIVLTTPGLLWKMRWIFGGAATVVLLSNGVPLKAPGVLSNNFTPVKALKYKSYWRDIDQIWVSSTLERYVAASSLDISIDRIRVTGSARQSVFDLQGFDDRTSAAKTRLRQELAIPSSTTRIVLIALTQRAYKGGFDWTALQSLRRLTGFSEEKFYKYLKTNNIQIVIRNHFLTSDNPEERSSDNISFMPPSLIPELNDVIAGFDVVITDYSGLYLDILKWPISIGLLRFPGDDFCSRRGLVLPDEFLNADLKISSWNELCSLLDQREPTPMAMQNRALLHNLFFEIENSQALDNNWNTIRSLLKIK